MTDIKEARDILAGAEIIHSAETVAVAVSRVAGEITDKQGESNPLVLITQEGGLSEAQDCKD